MLKLIGKSDSVELKLTVPDEDRWSAAAALGVDPLNARIRQVFFFDTPDLKLDSAGIVVRARRTQGAPDDTVVKLRPVVPDQLPADLRARKDFKVEVDAMPGSYVCSASFRGAPKAGSVRETLERRPAAAQAVLEGPARLLRRARARGHRASTTCRCSAR